MLLRLFGNIHPCQHPCTGCLCSVIELGDMTPGPHLGEELLAGKEPVHQEMQGAVQPVQEVHFTLTVMPVISHELADDRVFFLFYMGIVILVIRTGPGEGDLPGMAEADEVAGRGPQSRCPHGGRSPAQDTGGDTTQGQRRHTLLPSSVPLLPRSIPYSDP